MYIYHESMKVWRNKNDDGAISESKVSETIAKIFGGLCLANGHALDTTNYPTSKLHKSNLK